MHVINRVVRRCFLLGDDPVSGKNYDHRKVWLDEQLTHQAKYFGIDLLCQAIMSNHMHLVLRSRPDVVKEWGDNEVARLVSWFSISRGFARMVAHHVPHQIGWHRLNTFSKCASVVCK